MAWYEARSRCIGCTHERDCRNWLQGSEKAVDAPEFCLDAGFFRRCKGASRVCDAAQESHLTAHVRCPEECS
jgi:hypothetical protein